MRIRSCVFCLACIVAGTASATDLPRVFMTSVSGTGNLSAWPDAHGLTGLDAADEICRTRAAAVSLADADQYVALMSDSHDDAYCRLHGNSGKVADSCGSDPLPVDAGPWYRMDDLAAMDVAQNSLPAYPDVGYVPRAIVYDEFGIALPDGTFDESLAFTGTNLDGTFGGASCGDWSNDQDPDQVVLGSAYLGFGNLVASFWNCNATEHLICAEKGRHGPALPRARPANARMAFFTSSSGTADLSTWADAGGATSLDAADNICRASASRASLPLPQSYRAWLSTSQVDAPSRFEFDGPLYRVDGVRVVASMSDLSVGLLEAPMQLDESGTFGPIFFEDVWTGTRADGHADAHTCVDWTSSTDPFGGEFGQTYAADFGWTQFYIDEYRAGCGSPNWHLYCVGDNDSLFLQGFEDQ